MPAITTKSQKSRTVTPPAEEAKSAAASTATPSTEPAAQAKNHYGDSQPKVFIGSVREALELIKQVDVTAKPSGELPPITVTSKLDTLNTYIVDVDGKLVISGPLARAVANLRGLDLLLAGQGNPTVEMTDETGSAE